jgi:hypothetical protein
VQVRARHAACRTHLADLVSGFHFGSRRDTDVAQVTIECHETLAMVDEYRFAVEEEVADLDYFSGCRSEDGRTDRCGDIHPRVGITRLVVEHATQSERRRARTANG